MTKNTNTSNTVMTADEVMRADLQRLKAKMAARKVRVARVK